MQFQVRNDGVTVGRKCVLFNQYPVARSVGPEKGDHHQMEVHRQRIHGHYFGIARTHEVGERSGDRFVISDPGAHRLVMPEDAEAAPIGQFLLDMAHGRLRLQAQ